MYRDFLKNNGLALCKLVDQGRTPVPQIEDTLHGENLLQPLLQNLEQSYQEWPEHQQAEARKALNNMIDSPQITLQDP
ncbi:19487_t:CDS:2, partial [Gigaspora rosea]